MIHRDRDRREGSRGYYGCGGGGKHEQRRVVDGAEAPRWRRGGALLLREGDARRQNCRRQEEMEGRTVPWELS